MFVFTKSKQRHLCCLPKAQSEILTPHKKRKAQLSQTEDTERDQTRVPQLSQSQHDTNVSCHVIGSTAGLALSLAQCVLSHRLQTKLSGHQCLRTLFCRSAHQSLALCAILFPTNSILGAIFLTNVHEIQISLGDNILNNHKFF